MNDEVITPDWYTEAKATLGDRITGAREAAQLSQDALAKRLGIKLRTLKEWEDDLADPRANKLTLLAGVLNVSLRWLMTGEGEDLMPASGGVSRQEVAGLRAKLAEALEILDRIEERLGDE
ncbi:MAG: helix-turn-helix transcriptional regulator [Pseudomonadota bacterium]